MLVDFFLYTFNVKLFVMSKYLENETQGKISCGHCYESQLLQAPVSEIVFFATGKSSEEKKPHWTKDKGIWKMMVLHA